MCVMATALASKSVRCQNILKRIYFISFEVFHVKFISFFAYLSGLVLYSRLPVSGYRIYNISRALTWLAYINQLITITKELIDVQFKSQVTSLKLIKSAKPISPRTLFLSSQLSVIGGISH